MIKRFFAEESGMEMVEWAIVGVFFAVAGATLWQTLSGKIGTALTTIGDQVSGGGGGGN